MPLKGELQNRVCQLISLTAGVTVLGGATLSYAHYVEPYWLDVSRHKVPLRGLSQRWQGYRIAFLTDLHLGVRGKPLTTISAAVQRILELRPNLVAFGGDFLAWGIWNPAMAEVVCPLIEAGLPVVAVMGNHDYFGKERDSGRVIGNLRKMGVKLLLNQPLPVSYKGEKAWVIGLDDMHRGRPNVAEATATLPPGTRPLLTLTHNPDFTPALPPDFTELVLCGHTHGGQVNPALPPFHDRLNWTRFTTTSHRTHYPLGWYEVNRNRLYVSRGLGMSGMKLRFNARPELALFEFV